MGEKGFDQLNQATLIWLRTLERQVEESGVTVGRQRADCILWKREAIARIAEAEWENFVERVYDCSLPSATNPHHWVELQLKNTHTRAVWDGTGLGYLHNVTVKPIDLAAQDWSGFVDLSAEKIPILPDDYAGMPLG